jgi:hypothetical protein
VSAKGAHKLMSRLERAASTAGSDVAARETVRSTFASLLNEEGATVAPFVVKVLSGGFGADAALACWSKVVARGIAIAGDESENPVRAPFAVHCMFRGRLDILREVVLKVSLDAVPPGIRPPGRSQLMDLLCTTKSGREHPSFDGFDGFHGLVGAAAMYAKDCPHAIAALELAWEVNPAHCGFDELAEEASEEGAFVRAFLMNKDIEMAAAPPSVAAAQSARARPKRSI